MNATLHDAYAIEYDAQVRAYDCHIHDVLFGLCYEYIRPGQRLLDAGIGSGLSAQSFARAGLTVYGMDFAPAMLDVCRTKRFAADLRQHDLLQIPWPYQDGTFDHVVCCGVLHFIAGLDGIFGEVARLLMAGGVFAFTTRVPDAMGADQPYARHVSGEFEVFSHASGYIETRLVQLAFTCLKRQKCFVGEDLFQLWIVRGSH